MSTKLFTTATTPSEVLRTIILPGQIVSYESGLEQRNKVWANPRFQFEVRWPYLTETEITSVSNFFVEHGGDAETFLYQPPAISAISSGQVLGIGNAARTLFKIYGNRMAAASLYIDGAGGASYTVSLTNGTATYTSAPASGTVVTADVSSERYAVRFAEGRAGAEFFFNNLTRNYTVMLLQDKGLA